ncbi:MAG: beta-galactosidase [Thermoleophilaceae bacterium]|nr:beta-galactosidase [Thermoleophilaceae bacterium]
MFYVRENRWPRHSTAASLALVFLLLVAATPAADAARRLVPHGFYGVMWDGAAARVPEEQQAEQWDLMARSGVESVRTVFSWARAQPADGHVPDFTATDRIVALAAARRIRLLPVVYRTPAWAARDEHPGSPPANVETYTAYLQALVLRYGPRGSFWQEHPALPYRPLREWQIWNEPHLDVFWHVPGDDSTVWAREYVSLLKESRRAITSVDRGAKIVLAALADASWERLTRLYRAGARGSFDAVAINIFTGSPRFVMLASRLVRRVLRREREPRKPIFVTETTFPAGKGRVSRPPLSWQRAWYTTDRGMAVRLRRLYRLGVRNRRRLGLARIYWYTWASNYSGQDDLFDYSGLVRLEDSFIPQPALRAYAASARRAQGCRKTAAGICR